MTPPALDALVRYLRAVYPGTTVLRDSVNPLGAAPRWSLFLDETEISLTVSPNGTLTAYGVPVLVLDEAPSREILLSASVRVLAYALRESH